MEVKHKDINMKEENKKLNSCNKSDCECSSQKQSAKTGNSNGEKTEAETPQDPTRFGDWEVNGRAIDF